MHLSFSCVHGSDNNHGPNCVNHLKTKFTRLNVSEWTQVLALHQGIKFSHGMVFQLLFCISFYFYYPQSASALAMIVSSTAAAARTTMEVNSMCKIIYSYSSLRKGMLVNRYKRFLADIEFESDSRSAQLLTSSVPAMDDSTATITVVHCPNTGSMYKLIPPTNPRPECACSTAPEGSKRKYPNTLEMIKENDAWVGVHSALANSMVENALKLK